MLRRASNPVQVGWARSFSNLIHAWLGALLVAALTNHAAGAEPVYAFVRASPLAVYSETTLKSSTQADFEFGSAYEVLEQNDKVVKLKLLDGKEGYLKADQVFVTDSPKWAVSTEALNRSYRSRLRLWQKADDLKSFLGGNTSAEWDFDELLQDVPTFPMRLPILASRRAKVLDSDREVATVGVLFPFSGEAKAEFDAVKSGHALKAKLHILADVSGSTQGFLEPAVEATLTLLRRKELKHLVGEITLTTFSSHLAARVVHEGALTVDELTRKQWHAPKPAASDDEEPLALALAALETALEASPKSGGVVLVLSGSDVKISGYHFNSGRNISIETLALPPALQVLLVQVTPEPGFGLENAANGLAANKASVIGYSDGLARELTSRLPRLLDETERTAVEKGVFKKFGSLAHYSRTLPLLPRKLGEKSALPEPPEFSPGAKWYTAPLYIAVDDLIFKVSDK